MSDWIAISDRRDARFARTGARIDRGLFVMELALPIAGSVVLLNHQTDAPEPHTFSVFLDPAAGLMILHRQGPEVRRHAMPGPLWLSGGVARVSFAFDVAARRWQLQLDLLGGEAPLRVSGVDPLPLALDHLLGLCAGQDATQRHPAVLWFGATRGGALPGRAPWIGLNTRVDTPNGPVAAGLLRPGDRILTLDDGPLPLLRVTRRDLPSAGFFAPVLLRAPFYGATRDLLVSADQPVMLSGTLVEYHFGEDEVLIPAGALIDGRKALVEQRRAVTQSVALDLGCPALFTADGCVLMSDGSDRLTPPPRRILAPYEAKPLIGHSGRTLVRGFG
jgi:hypothetical protein